MATRKVKGLLECGALVTVVSPTLTPELQELVGQSLCQWKEKTYDNTDLNEVMLVFACTGSREVNARISEDATKRQLLVNVADCPDLCSFYLPSVLRRGMLSIAVSTEGSSPLTARHIRENLEEQFDDAMGTYLELLQSWREKITTTLPPEKRLLFWQQASEEQIYELVKQNQLTQAEAILNVLYTSLCKAK